MSLSIKDLNSVGDEELERIIKSLLFIVIGSGVTPFSTGKDGAREATFEGKANYPSEAENWDGHWIFQVKYSDLSLGITQARNKIKSHINSELKKLENYGYFDNNRCDNYIFITNVPFTGQAKVGLHDYIKEKSSKYRLKNFDYWDGQKIISLLNANPAIKTSFFESNGFESISKDELKFIEEIYVPPEQYSEIETSFFDDRIVVIVGQPHIGKTITSKYLALSAYKSKCLNQIFYVYDVEFIKNIPHIRNSVIILDDLFGDIDYQDIGAKTKIVKSLIIQNYVIITSRDYIYAKAKAKRPSINELISKVQYILQEGSYNSSNLKDILKRHLDKRKNELPKSLLSLISNKHEMIVNQLRFPHNLELFVVSLDESIQTYHDLKKHVKESKKVETILLSWVKNIPREQEKILLICSLFRRIKISNLINIVDLLWGIDEVILNESISTNRRILNVSDGYIRFNHPSFKNALYQNFIKNYADVNKIIYDIMTNKEIKNSIKRDLNLAFQDTVKQYSINELVETQAEVGGGSNIQNLIWCRLIKLDYKFTIHHFLTLYNNVGKSKIRRGLLVSFSKSKKCVKKKNVNHVIDYLMKFRETNYKSVVDYLIALFAYENRSHLSKYISELNESDYNSLKLKVQLLGIMGTEHANNALAELERLGKNKNSKIRKYVYSSLNVISKGNEKMVLKIFKSMIKEENNEKNVNHLNKAIDRLQKF